MKKLSTNMIFIAFFSFLKYNVAFASGPEGFSFSSKDNSVKLSYEQEEKISVIVTIHGKEAYHLDFMEDYGDPEVDFVDINNDKVQDIIVKLQDESGFEPIFLLSNTKNNTFGRALSQQTMKVDYANLETDAPGKLHDALVAETNGTKSLVFHHLYIGQTLKHNVKLKLSKNKTDLMLEKE